MAMATLQSISKRVNSLDDVITSEPITAQETNNTNSKLSNGKIRTKDLAHGVAKSFSEPKTRQKEPYSFSEKTKKKMSLFKKRSQELIRENEAHVDIKKAEGISSTELGEYHFKRRVSHFVNMAFENNELETSNLTFADVVRKVINDPIKEDIHPFGRGHLYASAFDGERPKIHHDEGKYLMWILASLLIVGIAGSVILMSITYQPEVVNFDLATSTTITRLNTTT